MVVRIIDSINSTNRICVLNKNVPATDKTSKQTFWGGKRTTGWVLKVEILPLSESVFIKGIVLVDDVAKLPI